MKGLIGTAFILQYVYSSIAGAAADTEKLNIKFDVSKQTASYGLVD